MGRLILYGYGNFVSDWLEREPMLIREQCPVTGMTPLGAVIFSSNLPGRFQKVPRRVAAAEWGGFRSQGLAGQMRSPHCIPGCGQDGAALELDARPIPYIIDGSRITLLSAAASNGQIEMLRLLLEWHAKSGLFTAAELDQALGWSKLNKQGAAEELLTQSGANLVAPPVGLELKPHPPRLGGRPDALSQGTHMVRPRVL
jgi:ankyrin repeat protein